MCHQVRHQHALLLPSLSHTVHGLVLHSFAGAFSTGAAFQSLWWIRVSDCRYAYIYIAVIGEAFVPSACKSFQLFAKYPAQVALNQLTTWALGFLVCLGVPLSLAGLAFFELRESLMTYQACATALMILAFIVTHMAIGVYDVVVTSLLICAMRDEEHCGAQYMSESLRRAAGFDRREIEFSS